MQWLVSECNSQTVEVNKLISCVTFTQKHGGCLVKMYILYHISGKDNGVTKAITKVASLVIGIIKLYLISS